MPSNDNGWIEYKRLVLSSMEQSQREHVKIRDELSALRTDIAGLKVRAGVWGGLAGLIPVLVGLSVLLLGKLL